MVQSPNVTKQELLVRYPERVARNGHSGGVFWLTGLSGAGKSTLASRAERGLFDCGWSPIVLDGDNLRTGLNCDLGFEPADRVENIRRVGELAALFAGAGHIVLTAFISPYARDRMMARQASAAFGFHEIYLSASLQSCENRDVKGLYRKARRGEIADFTGISAPYEAPEKPELQINTGDATLEVCVQELVGYIKGMCQLPAKN